MNYGYDYGAGPPPVTETQPSYAAVQQLCKQPGNGVTAWPFAEIGQKVGLNGEQKALLDDLKSAAKKAAQSVHGLMPGRERLPDDASGPPRGDDGASRSHRHAVQP